MVCLDRFRYLLYCDIGASSTSLAITPWGIPYQYSRKNELRSGFLPIDPVPHRNLICGHWLVDVYIHLLCMDLYLEVKNSIFRTSNWKSESTTTTQYTSPVHAPVQSNATTVLLILLKILEVNFP